MMSENFHINKLNNGDYLVSWSMELLAGDGGINVNGVGNTRQEALRDLADHMDVMLKEYEVKPLEISESSITASIRQRDAARKKKNWTESDRIRAELLAQGVMLKDTADETVWRRIPHSDSSITHGLAVPLDALI